MTADAKTPPSTFEDLIALIHEDYDNLSKTNKQIAVYVTQNPNDVAMNAVNGIAEVQGSSGLPNTSDLKGSSLCRAFFASA